MLLKPRFNRGGFQATEDQSSQAGRQVEPDGLLVGLPGAHPHPRSFVLEPPIEELRDGLPLVGHHRAVLRSLQ
jgi:hypothetical protein